MVVAFLSFTDKGSEFVPLHWKMIGFPNMSLSLKSFRGLFRGLYMEVFMLEMFLGLLRVTRSIDYSSYEVCLYPDIPTVLWVVVPTKQGVMTTKV